MRGAGGYVVAALVALALGWFGAVKRERAGQSAGAPMQCPMHPWIQSVGAGKCTICGMDLVPMHGAAHASTTAVLLSPESVRASGVRTAEVRRAVLVRTLRLAGKFEEDATTHAVISAPVAGRIDGLGLVHDNGKVVQRQPLATMFSPTLLAAAKQYKDALNHDETAAAAARKKLEEYGLVEEQINAIPQRQEDDPYFGILSPRTGSVLKSYVHEGQYVRAGEPLFEITDPTKLWFMFPVFEQDLPMVAAGQVIDLETTQVPAQKFQARITAVDRQLDETTRTAHVRVELENPKSRFRLHADGIATVTAPPAEVLAVPRAAVLWPGAGPRVYVETQPGAYEPRAVQLGRAGDDEWEVLAGLKEGERVVTQAAMLIDGQAQLSATAQ